MARPRPKRLKTFEARNAAEWRRWLVAHHDSESELWLVFNKRRTGRASVAYLDALDEALCFGWIDSLIKRLDESRYARKFTPRKPDSRWSSVNRKRYLRLAASGRLKPSGLERAPTDRSYDAPKRSFSALPTYIRDALRRHPAAWSYFCSLAPSYRRHFVGWIEIAKREETKARRLQGSIRLLTARRKLGLK